MSTKPSKKSQTKYETNQALNIKRENTANHSHWENEEKNPTWNEVSVDQYRKLHE